MQYHKLNKEYELKSVYYFKRGVVFLKLRVIAKDIQTGNTNIIVLNHEDALKLDLFPEDRVLITNKNKSIISIVDIAYSMRTVPAGYIMIYQESAKKLDVSENPYVSIELADKPSSLKYIRKKLEGKTLTKNEYFTIISDIVKDKLTDIELTYFVAACSAHNLSLKEIKYLINAIVNTGITIKPKSDIIVDKHCVGGVPGNRTTMIVIPIVAAAGYTFPKTSSRAITSPAGTADTMECLCNVSLDKNKIKAILNKVNACLVWGGALNLAPADDKIIRIEHPLSIDVSGLLLSSVISKKISVSTNHLLIDIPWGPGSKIENKSRALNMKKSFETIAKSLKIKIKVVLTDGSKPIGKGIGPALEAIDGLKVLNNNSDAPKDLIEKSVFLAGELFDLIGRTKKGDGKKLAIKLLKDGSALKKMNEILEFQGKIEQIKPGKYTKTVYAYKSGIIKHLDNKFISRIATLAGAPQDKGAGLYIYKNKNSKVTKRTKILTIYSNSRTKLNYSIKFYKKYLKKNIIIE